MGPLGPHTAAQKRMPPITTAAATRSFQMPCGAKGMPSFFMIASYSLSYVSRRTRCPGFGYSLIPLVSTMRRCIATSARTVPGRTKTCSEKKRESVSEAMIGTPKHQIHQAFSDERDTPKNGRTDAKAPVSILVPAQHLAGEGQTQRADHEDDTGHPRNFARILVGAPEIDLRHVEQHGADHEVGSPIVHRPQVPSEVLFVGQIEKAVVGFRGRGHVDKGQQAARDDLKNETKQGRAAKNVEPAGGTLGNRVPGRVFPQV